MIGETQLYLKQVEGSNYTAVLTLVDFGYPDLRNGTESVRFIGNMTICQWGAVDCGRSMCQCPFNHWQPISLVAIYRGADVV